MPRWGRGVAIVVLLAGGLTALAWSRTRYEPRKISGFVEADEIRVGSRVGGRVKAVRVAEGQIVADGDLLVELEAYDLEQRLAEAEAERAARKAAYEKVKAGPRAEEKAVALARRDQSKAVLEEAENGPRPQELTEARENVKLAEAELDLAEKELARTSSLYGQKLASKEEYDRAVSRLQTARANVRAQQAKLAVLEEGTRRERIAQAKAAHAAAQAEAEQAERGSRAEDIAEAQARLEAAEAALSALREQVAELIVRAPAPSTVEAVDLEPGDLIAANAPTISLMDTRRLRVRAYVPEDLLGLVKVGSVVPMIVDSFPSRKFRGRVSYVSRQAEFTPGNVQTPEERSKQVFRIRVELMEGLDQLRPGMAADVLLDEARVEEAPR